MSNFPNKFDIYQVIEEYITHHPTKDDQVNIIKSRIVKSVNLSPVVYYYEVSHYCQQYVYQVRTSLEETREDLFSRLLVFNVDTDIMVNENY